MESYLKDTLHGGPGVCLGDGQTEAEGVLSQGGRGDALLRRMAPYLTSPDQWEKSIDAIGIRIRDVWAQNQALVTPKRMGNKS